MNTSIFITHSRNRQRHRRGRRVCRILLAALLLMCTLGAATCPMVAHAEETEVSLEIPDPVESIEDSVTDEDSITQEEPAAQEEPAVEAPAEEDPASGENAEESDTTAEETEGSAEITAAAEETAPVAEEAPTDTPQGHRTIPTVDSAALGVRMYMYNFPMDHRIFQSNDDQDASNDIGLVQSVLGDDGYPVLSSNGQSFKTWFDPASNEYDAMQVNHLFSQPVYDSTGYLVYDCTENYAYLDQESGNFKVYEDVGVPVWPSKVLNYGEGRPYATHGQFFPYDDLTDTEESFAQTTDAMGNAFAEGDSRSGRTLYRSTGYTYHFGMYLDANFIQPVDGMVTANGNAENMRYEFSGDDDLYVFIDGVLVLDIGGTHFPRSGYIDFATGEVYLQALGKTTTIRDLFREAGAEDRAQWNGNTFADLSEHTFKMFYMERGEYYSNLYVKMNLITVPDSKAIKAVYNEAGTAIDGQPVQMGEELTYTITANNQASVTKEMIITDILPEEVEFVSADEGGSCENGVVTWTLSAAGGAERTVSFKCRIKKGTGGSVIYNSAVAQVGRTASRTNEVSNTVRATYSITTSIESGEETGTITPSEADIPAGESRTISYQPADGYALDCVVVDGEAVDVANAAETYTFPEIDRDHTVVVNFVKVEIPVAPATDTDSNSNQPERVVTQVQTVTETRTVTQLQPQIIEKVVEVPVVAPIESGVADPAPVVEAGDAVIATGDGSLLQTYLGIAILAAAILASWFWAQERRLQHLLPDSIGNGFDRR